MLSCSRLILYYEWIILDVVSGYVAPVSHQKMNVFLRTIIPTDHVFLYKYHIFISNNYSLKNNSNHSDVWSFSQIDLYIYVQYTGSIVELPTCTVRPAYSEFFFFLKFLEDTSPFSGALFWTSDDVSSGFQSQSGSPYLRASSRACNGIIRFTSGATPADHLAAKNIRIYNYIHRHQFIVSSAVLTELF